VFDIETYSPSESEKIDTDEFRTSVIGAYYSWTDSYVAFLEEDAEYFTQTLQKADVIVGYNHIWFDLPVLQKYSHYDLLGLPNYDIMVEIEKKLGFKPKLNDIAKANLGEFKTDSYEQFKNYYKDKNWEPLIDYCMNDVRLTKDLFDMVLSQNPIKYNDLLDTKEVILDKPKPGVKSVSTPIQSLL
jgi:DEAD/DEAH box helicase domain-containing protein